MGKLSAKLRSTSYGPAFWCPGCNSPHIAYLPGVQPNGHAWGWDGNVDLPTFTPSLKSDFCHVTVTKGRMTFASDSLHALKNQTVDLPDWPPDV